MCLYALYMKRYNIISISVLFIYMFRDLGGYVLVWQCAGKIERQQNIEYNPFHRSRLQDIGAIVDVRRWDYHNLDPTKVEWRKHRQNLIFIHIRILIIGVFTLYFMLTVYSLVQIAVTDGLADKLEASLAIFFLLEVDDWAYELFFGQNGLLDDAQFDVEFDLEHIDIEIRQKDNDDHDQRGFTFNTLLTNKIGNVRKEIYEIYMDDFDDLKKSSIILWNEKRKTKLNMDSTIKDCRLRHNDVILWDIDKSMDNEDDEDMQDFEKNALFAGRTKKLWCSLWFVYGGLGLVLIWSFLYPYFDDSK